MWPQRNGPSNCLAKTQVYAKPKGEVYGLTPARCSQYLPILSYFDIFTPNSWKIGEENPNIWKEDYENMTSSSGKVICNLE